MIIIIRTIFTSSGQVHRAGTLKDRSSTGRCVQFHGQRDEKTYYVQSLHSYSNQGLAVHPIPGIHSIIEVPG